MNFQTPYPNWMELNLGSYLYRRLGPQAYFDTALSQPYLDLLPQPSVSYMGYSPHRTDRTMGLLETVTEGLGSGGGQDPLESFFDAKRSFWAKSVEEILGLIHEREHIKYDNMQKIDYEWCQTKSRLFEFDHWRRGFNPQVERLCVQVERELATLEREKRFEEVACWRDVARLRTELREALGELNQENRKGALLAGDLK